VKSELARVVHSINALEWNAFDGFANVAVNCRINEEEEIYVIPLHPIASILFNDLTTSIDWNEASTPIDLAKITVTALNQDSQTNLSLIKILFQVDSSA
jgi:hypothetical protein